LNRDLVVVVVCAVGLVFLFFVAPFSLFAVFYYASAFNQDVSNWNTGAVIYMTNSKCTLSAPFRGHAFSIVCFWKIYDNSNFIGSHNSDTFCNFNLVFYLWWVGLSFSLLHPLFLVFDSASAFNQDVSKWSTVAVTNMGYSKCTLCLPLNAGHAFRCRVFE